ncbi:unnamed protein product, partial [Ranitomeya imitator]
QVESSDCPGVDTVVDRLQQIWTHVVDNLTLSQENAQRFANCRRCVGTRLRVGDLVWLSSRYIPMKVSSPKFKPRFIGPYRISEVLNPVSFHLTLPVSFSIHNIFHRSLLRRYVAPVVPSVDPPAPVLVEGEMEYIVEKILDSRISRRKLQYLVKWKGYGQEDNSWVFASDVHAADLVRAFHLAHPGQPGGSACYIDFSCLLEALRRRGSTSVPLVGHHVEIFCKRAEKMEVCRDELWMKKLIMGSRQDEEKKQNDSRYDIIYKVPESRPESKNLLQFRKIIKCIIPDSRPLDEYNGYGCYCGLGGSGAPVDELDKCCQIHDDCYSQYKSIQNCNIIFDNPYTEFYAYSCTDNTVTCKSSNNPCEMHICECDKQAALCFSKASYNEAYKNLDKRKHC